MSLIIIEDTFPFYSTLTDNLPLPATTLFFSSVLHIPLYVLLLDLMVRRYLNLAVTVTEAECSTLYGKWQKCCLNGFRFSQNAIKISLQQHSNMQCLDNSQLQGNKLKIIYAKLSLLFLLFLYPTLLVCLTSFSNTHCP